MRAVFNAGVLLLALTAMPVATQAGTLEGVAIGAGSGALIAGPPGAIVGGVIGGWWAGRTSIADAIATAGSMTMAIAVAAGAELSG